MSPFIRSFRDIRNTDTASVGGKNASLGEMISQLSQQGILVPDGFAITVDAFHHFIEFNKFAGVLENMMAQLDATGFSNLREVGAAARALMLDGLLPGDLAAAVEQAYQDLGKGKETAVAVRSSATAEDLPQASFAGQHESYLNIAGFPALLEAVKKCFASLYTDRAIKYRVDQGFEHDKVALSVGVQLMVRSDLACSGVGFTLEPESGFKNVIHLSGVWGLGENMVQGTVSPDEFLLFKPALIQGNQPIIQKKLGQKEKTMVYGQPGAPATLNLDTAPEKRDQFVLEDPEIIQLAKWALIIERHYKKCMDIEWAKDGISGELFIIQARPETVHSQKDPMAVKEYRLLSRGKALASGEAIGSRVTAGIARIIASPQQSDGVHPGDIVVTDVTSPDWDPILKRAGAIVTNKGGRTSHASIVARELGVPAVVGTGNATGAIIDGQVITVSCCEGKVGFIYEGKLNYSETSLDFSQITKPRGTEVMLIMSDPEKAFSLARYPNDGVGLLRIEFIIAHSIGIHPMALVKYNELKNRAVKQKIGELTRHYPDKRKYFIDQLSQGVGCIAAAFFPKEVIVRMSDFKTNEYARLLGGEEFEPVEENPMLGFRGASRYYHDLYREGFRMECEAMKKVRNEMGLTNVKLMIPFCRTVEEGKKVLEVMRQAGLRQGDRELEIYVMAEIPSNVLQAEEFAQLFDGFSIGSNDLTQLTLGIDRDSALVANLFSEENKSAKEMISTVIRKAKYAGSRVGICGQAPSDFPDFAQFLVDQGIDSISFNPDALLQGIANINLAEQKRSVSAH